ncbi:MAG: response regulator transcription factor [Rhodocyclaceae bacterium]|jgi:DNA-binding response OmpR family regulator|nr:response regulator transcription factor [Rhodocyclaceae bacterium]MDP2194939.1 response regulator transcription factor [Rhodocyclaceae bacterium]
MRILIVEDDTHIAENLVLYLEMKGHECDYATSCRGARERIAQAEFDALIVDRGLPDSDGLALIRELRAQGNSLWILVLTARDTLQDKLAGFDAGADDYLPKPFALQEVEARLAAIARRGKLREDAGVWRLGDIEYDAAAQEVRRGGVALHLPPKALRLLAVMLPHPNRAFSRRELELAIWGHEHDSSDNLRSLLHTVRRQLGETCGVEIVNRHGLGYKLALR